MKNNKIHIKNSGHKCKFCGNSAFYKFENGNWYCSESINSCPAQKEKNKRGQENKLKLIPIENSGHKCKWCGKTAFYKFKNGDWCCENHNTKCESEKKKIGKKSKGRIITKPIYIENSGYKCKWCEKPAFYKFKNGDWCCENHCNKCLSQKEKQSKRHKYTIKDYQEKYPFFCKIEELKENPKTGQIQARCKNHNCKNSKELGGWFIPTSNQIMNRCAELIYENRIGGCYFYCSDFCRQTCDLYKKSTKQIMRRDLINAGRIEESESSIPGYEIWRNEVYKRNKKEYKNIQCEICGETNTLIAHHIYPQKSHPEQTLDPDNGIIVCQKCHLEKCHPKGSLCSFVNLRELICEKKYNQNIIRN